MNIEIAICQSVPLTYPRGRETFLAPPAVEQTQITQVISRIHTEQTIETTTQYSPVINPAKNEEKIILQGDLHEVSSL